MRRIRRAGTLSALAILLAACGGSGDEVLSGDELTRAADQTVEQRSARFSAEIEIEGILEQPLLISAESEASLSSRQARTTMDFPLVLLGQQDAGDQTQPVTVLIDGSVVHISFPFLAESLSSPTPWIRMDLNELPAGAEDLRSLATGQNDASQVLNYLRGAVGDFTRVGAADVRGVATAHYRGTIDLDLAAERAPEAVREAVEASRSEVETQTGTTRLPTEVWVDEDGLVRRVRYSYDLPVGSTEGNVVFTTDLFDFGLEVDVSPPPSDEVTDILELVPSG